MNPLCKIGIHKWEEYTESTELEYLQMGPRKNTLIKSERRGYFRICKRCLKKQESIINKAFPTGPLEMWVNRENNLEEKREITLRKLNIK
jgi:lambda repressor-like predicted transcriptional regulator